jgi:amidohydrolase
VNLRRALHRAPELSFQEHGTAARVEGWLAEHGLRPERVAGTGVVALLDSGRPGRTVLLRADMDALPIQEANAHDYASVVPGVMHACGHDGHTAILCHVARALVELRDTLQGRVLFVFQPAEEGVGGALSMLEAGLVERFRPDCAVGLHLWSELPTGELAITDGPFMASADQFEVVISGRGGHGAMPHQARDPIVAAAEMVLALQTVVSRTVDPEQPAVLTIGHISAGSAFNVIPDGARLGGTVRTYSKAVKSTIQHTLARVVQGVASAHGVTAELHYEEITLPVVNDPVICALAREAAARVGAFRFAPPGYRTMAAEDFSYFLDRVPGVFFFVGAGNPEVGAAWPHHHPRFEIDERALTHGCELLVEIARSAAAPE